MYEKIQLLLKNFSIVDASIRSKDYIYLLATHIYELDEDDDEDSENQSSLQDTENLPKQAIRIIAYYPNKPKEKQWGFQTIKNIEFMKCASSSIPISQFVAVSIDGKVYSIGGGKAGFEQPVPEAKEGPLRGSVSQVLAIGGAVYVVQGNRGLCKRIGENNWQTLCSDLPVSNSWQARDERGFTCAAGINENSIYAAGGRGDLWHYDGCSWRELAFPTNSIIESICVDPTGKVYIGCQSGQIYAGSGDVWKEITNEYGALPFKSMVWYQDKVWCTSSYGAWTITGEAIEKANIPDHINVKAGHLSVGDGLLLIAGDTGAAYFDGTKWHDFLNFS